MLVIGITLGCEISTVALMMALSTLAAGVMQVGLVWWAVERLAVHVRFVKIRIPPEIREIGRKMMPGILGAGVWQINLLVDVQACSFLKEGAVSYVYFADRINQLPLGTLGIAMSTVLLPTLSKLLQGGKTEQAAIEFNRGVSLAFFLAVPAAFCMITIPHILTTIVYERGSFLGCQVDPVAYALRAFACGLPAYIGTKIFSSAFFAQGDTQTPVKVGLISVFANIVFILLLAPPMKHVGVALATAFSSWINVGVLYVLLCRRAFLPLFPKTRRRCGKQLISALLMAVAMGWMNWRAETVFAQSALLERIKILLLVTSVPCGLYALLTYLLDAWPALGSRPQER
jgi:putative peptidoglycan lipid II flippase